MTVHYSEYMDGLTHYLTTCFCKGIARVTKCRTPYLTATNEVARVTCKRCLAKIERYRKRYPLFRPT